MRLTSISSKRSLTHAYLQSRQEQVLDAIDKYQPVNNRQLAKFTGLPINVVTPRTNELVKKHDVKVAYRGIDPITNRQTIYWKLDDSDD